VSLLFQAVIAFLIFSFATTAVQYFPGNLKLSRKTMTLTDVNRERALEALRTLCSFSVSATEDKAVIFRNWICKLSAIRTLGGEPSLHPFFLDVFVDEGHRAGIRSLWKAYVEFVGTNPGMEFIERWAQNMTDLTSEDVKKKFDPFSVDKGILPPVPEQSQDALEKLKTAFGERYSNDADEEKALGEHDEDLQKHTYDVALGAEVTYCDQTIKMMYVARGKPEYMKKKRYETWLKADPRNRGIQPNPPPETLRTVHEKHWVCLNIGDPRVREDLCVREVSDFSAVEGEVDENLAWSKPSHWELARRCFGYVVSTDRNANTVTLSHCSKALIAYLTQLEYEFHGENVTVDEKMVCAYQRCRGKAGALNHVVQLIRHRCTEEDKPLVDGLWLFAIFDARHMAAPSWWTEVVPEFFEEDTETIKVNTKISFVQAPQHFARMEFSIDYLDVQNGMQFNFINHNRNKCGGVTSCGTNACWLLHPQKKPAR